jgi:hypothetical protein
MTKPGNPTWNWKGKAYAINLDSESKGTNKSIMGECVIGHRFQRYFNVYGFRRSTRT